MERFEHGGNIYEYEGVLDFSANLSPLGMPACAKQALAASLDALEPYPDPKCRALVQAIATFEQVDPDYVLPCAGATDAITRLCHVQAKQAAGGTALVCAPCYSGYEQAAEQAGMTVEHHVLAEADGFRVSDTILEQISEGFDVVFLANPNNPTGLLLDDGLLYDILETADEAGTLVVLDECFVDLVPPEAVGDIAAEVSEEPADIRSNCFLDAFPNLIIVKALTKTFALAGLRAGYALCSDLDLVDDLRAAGHPWAVSTPAQVAAVAALHDTNYVQHAQQVVAEQRTRLTQELQNAGFTVVPGQANYLLFAARDAAEAQRMYDAFLKRGILLRRCNNYQGLDGKWLRMAVRSADENTRFLDALQEVVS